ncbi:ADP-L-glycero-D-manno-heptose-6-epimerase [Candidatus Kaiserbacteria bacterium RIFCSPHIGHO2_02_FULL_55_20]|uniref:ADP-L-glycero-D-manno-heptose-6-epimerase n=1 Tax=Candidatus Kaiserbacteria bacterium RIFCSPHIGHO2_02_FULL_55_20 TaxID=1798497 RepID=A0A1F6DYR0_9BACT|nr:MAG: ADP-L-glycero-D-manno-heptose-6-epimerase [Candidatus Kaiserbacteria bacterium RIFCSPHIGHO2_01_FULL_55_37]OGG66526.1 MAG: ADP-L-glycero-D-manno-heptose-6-epimerase [Candidatus Kaiserbacteria bacterium RIFCSPHIGHO2_02_FULL_55_20]
MSAQKKTVLVTGGAGFIGSHLCNRLKAEGHTVISLDNYFTGSRENHVSGVEYREGHTKDIEKHVPETPDIIYHLGEYSRVEKSMEEPGLVWDLNISGTFGVVEYWRKRKCKLVYAGSSTKFGDGGLSRDATPYAWTKASNTELVSNYADWYKLPYAITYFYNVYGPGERAGAYGTVVEIFRQQYAKGGPLTVVSPGTQKRNFTHVDDIVEGLMLVGEKGEGDDFGLGATREYSILDVAQMFSQNITMLPERAGNRLNSGIDTSKSKALGWDAKHDLETYVKAIIGSA